MNKKKVVKIVQQFVWDIEATGLESMPLAAGYLKAFACKDTTLRKELDIQICNYDGSATSLDIVRKVVIDNVPDVICFSVYGWNLKLFGRVAETYRQFNSAGWVIFGGPHVTNQADYIFRTCPEVDIIVNYEGEITFSEILKNYLAEKTKYDLYEVNGISFRKRDGTIANNPKRERMVNLDEIPSPFITGAIPLTSENGDFKYDVALIETNRGCPYQCAFCFWGGAIGQKLSYFSIDRLKEEIELFARFHVRDIVLCDANFGMTENDVEFIELLIKTKEKYGYPKRVISSWVKIKNKPFYKILERMNETGLGTSISVSLQSLYAPALELMQRRNMTPEAMKRFFAVTSKNNVELYGELIWGLPGETYQSFIEGYDILSKDVPRIAIYPHLLLPNTTYYEKRKELGIRTLRSGADDFEYIITHNTMSFNENQQMQKFIFWARILFEYPFFRYIMYPLRSLVNITQSQLILSLDRWIDTSQTKVSANLQGFRDQVVEALDAYNIEDALYYLYQEPEVPTQIMNWWREAILPLIPEEHHEFFVELIKYDLLTKPIFGSNAKERDGRLEASKLDGFSTITWDNEEYYVRENNLIGYDFPEIMSCITEGSQFVLQPCYKQETLYYKVGFSDFISNHEFYNVFCGKTEQQLAGEAAHNN